MIVPFVFDLYEYSNTYPNLLMPFYKFVNFCIKYDMPIIAQEKFFVNPNEYKKSNHPATTKHFEEVHDYKVPTKDQINDLDKYVIDNNIINQIKKMYKNEDEMILSLLKDNNTILEKELEKIVKKILKKNKIDAFFVWCWNPTLEKVADKFGIKIISVEYSTIRISPYNDRLCYLKLKNKYDSKDTLEKYKEFEKNIDNKLILSRKELLLLFLQKDFISNINLLNSIPKYEVGYAFGLPNDKYEKVYSNIDNKIILEKILKMVDGYDTSIRLHPVMKNEFHDDRFVIDDSPSASIWLSKCKRVICNISNIGYEAMLYGKSVVHLNDSLPTSFCKKNNLNFLDDEVIGVEKLNFLTFYCYTPMDFAYNYDYLMFFLSNPTVNEIYMRNVEYVLSKKNIDINQIAKILPKNRMRYILEKRDEFSKDEIDYIINYKLSIDNKEIMDLTNENQVLKNKLYTTNKELNLILSSKSWKITAPLRNIFMKIKK